jgi:hypothetical protein
MSLIWRANPAVDPRLLKTQAWIIARRLVCGMLFP